MTEISPRERVQRVLRHQLTDRMPRTLDTGASPGIDYTYTEIFKRNSGAENPADYFDYDIRYVVAPLTPTAQDFSMYHESVPPGATFDEFGVGHVPAEQFPLGLYLHPWRRFTSPKQIHDYPYPTFEPTPELFKEIKNWQERGYAVSVAAGSINEWCYYLRGMEEFMIDLVDAPDMAETILNKVTDLSILMGSRLCETGVDILCFYGDSGGQHGMLMSPGSWRKWIKPRWEKIVKAVRQVNPNVFIFYHSCGCVEPIIPDLIEVGLDILNPVQPEAMDPFEIKRKYGNRIALWGGIGMQSTMLNHSSAFVREAVRRLVEAWAPGGGTIVTAAQTILPDVPWENVQTLMDAVETYSREATTRLR